MPRATPLRRGSFDERLQWLLLLSEFEALDGYADRTWRESPSMGGELPADRCLPGDWSVELAGR